MVPSWMVAGAVALLLPAAAWAQPPAGPYLAGGIGVNMPERADLDILGRQASVDFADGFAGTLALGWGAGNGLRLEIEGTSRSNPVERVTRNAVAVESGGRQRLHGVMANVLFEPSLPGFGFLQPFAGIGLGYAWTTWRQVSGVSAGRDGGRLVVDESDGGFAWQGILGTALPLTALAPGLAATVEYRYLGTASPRLGLTFTSGRGVSTQGSVTPDIRQHAVLFGLRYAFGP